MYSRSDPRYNSNTNSIRFSTESEEGFKPLADLFLDREGNKKIPLNIGEELTIRGLAH